MSMMSDSHAKYTRDILLTRRRTMLRILLIWNIVLTMIVLGGMATGFFLYNDYRHVTEERTIALSQHVEEMNAVVQEHTAVINEHAEIINNHITKMSDEYEATIEEQEQIINEMSNLISRYQEIINRNASYFEEILENLEDLSITTSE
jgi:uncharacterized coiled-coil protein SlyX